MTLRTKWEFEYTARALAEAAEKQHDFRKERVALWQQKKSEVMAKIREYGLTIHEGIAGALSLAGKYGNSSEHGAQVMVDSTLQRDLNECIEKINQHTALMTSYAAWAQVLNANPEARLKLDHDDWMFFFGK